MFNWLTRPLLVGAGAVIDGWGSLSDAVSSAAVNGAVGSTRNRPHPWSTYGTTDESGKTDKSYDYTTWRGLTDRSYLARHLPPAKVPREPDPREVRRLFERRANQQSLSRKSTCLFPAFAQYLTDGFIRTATIPARDARRTTTNHEIDLCPLYGRIWQQTDALRLRSNAAGRRGRLKSQLIGAEEYSPFLYGNGDQLADPAFAVLDPLLFFPGEDPPPERRATIFAIGGDRANSTPYTAMMNTLLLREHNRLAGELEQRNAGWDDDRVFETARNIMIVLFIKLVVVDYINHITPLPFSLRFDPSVAWNADWNRPNWITAEFSLLYRWHSLMPDAIEWPTGPIAVGNFSLNNRPLLDVGLDAAFSAAAAQPAGEIGAFNTAEALVDLEDLAVQQARFNRIDTYNNYRKAFGKDPAESFADISGRPEVADLLEHLYGHPDNVEFYPGLFAEDRVPDSPLPGLLMSMVAVDAFSQAYTNPLLSRHVFNADTFTQWGFELIDGTNKLHEVLARNVPARGRMPVEMTQADWRYANGPQ